MKTFLLVATLLTTFNASANASPDVVAGELASSCQVWAQNGHQKNIFAKLVVEAIVYGDYSIVRHMKATEWADAQVSITRSQAQDEDTFLTDGDATALLYKVYCKDIAQSII